MIDKYTPTVKTDADTKVKKPDHDPKTGQFNKGHATFNKGKKWSEWMPEEHREKLLAILAHGRGNPNLAGWNKKACVAFKDGRKVGTYESASESARVLNLPPRNISSCLRRKRHSCGGYIFYYRDEEREEWFDAMICHLDHKTNCHRTAGGRLHKNKKN